MGYSKEVLNGYTQLRGKYLQPYSRNPLFLPGKYANAMRKTLGEETTNA